MLNTPHAASSKTQARIASAPSLPPRVRRVLSVLFDQASSDLGERFNQMLADFEQQLFKVAEQERSNEKQAEAFAVVHALRNRRSDLLPMFLAGLEAELATVRLLREPETDIALSRVQFQTLTLVEDADMDQDIVLREIARIHDTRSNTLLYLMGQRFGVLAGSPAWEPAHIPLGPQVLCRVMRTAVAATFEFDLDSQLLLYKSFDLKVMAEYSKWIESLNGLLSQEGVLPGLIYSPLRPRSTGTGTSRSFTPIEARPPTEASRPMTDWYGQPSSAAAEHASSDAATFATLQQLLSGHRASEAPGFGMARGNASPGLGISLPTHDVLSSLRTLQAAPVVTLPGQRRRTVKDVQQAMLAQMREQHGPEAALVQEDADTFELLGLLYSEMEREVKRDAPAVDMLMRLQVPVVRAALQDREFFLRPQHPARELLNSVAESAATWLGDEEVDPQLVQKLNTAVDRVVANYQGDEEVFEAVNNDVQAHFRAMARKAEVAERRHVEAARGKDRLEVAKNRAAETIESALRGHEPQQFVQALMDQAWADVLTLSLLRNGDDSEEWQQHEAVTQRIVEATSKETPPDPELTRKIESALVQVGYHEDEASAIARRLSSAEDQEEIDSRSELTAKLKARTGLGEQHATRRKTAHDRTPEEQTCHEYLRTLPFGTWFEFIKNQQGDVNRRRLSWYSPVTDNALFVNQRGQRIGEQSLDSLARLMVREQVRVVTQDKGRMIDRAWKATLSALRNLAGNPELSPSEASA